MPDELSDMTITVSVSSILERIESGQAQGFSEIRRTLEGKASKSDVESVRRDFDHFKKDVGDRIAILEQAGHDAQILAQAGEQRHEAAKLTRHQRFGVAGFVLGLIASWGIAIASWVH